VAACARADAINGLDKTAGGPVSLADYFCRSSRLRIERSFRGLRRNTDSQGYRIAQDALKGGHDSLVEGIVRAGGGPD